MSNLAMGQFPGQGATQDTGQDLLSQAIGRRNDPLTMLAELRVMPKSNAPAYGGSSTGKSAAPSPADQLNFPDVDSALDAGVQRAQHASSKLTKNDLSAPDLTGASEQTGPLGIHPGLINLAQAMNPSSQDKSLALAKAGFGMANAAGHTGNFLTALSAGAGEGIDTLQKLRSDRAEMALKNAQFGSEDTLRQSQGEMYKAQAANFQRESFNGNYPYARMIAKKSNQPQKIMGPMGTPVWVLPNGGLQDADVGAGPTAQSSQGAGFASPFMGNQPPAAGGPSGTGGGPPPVPGAPDAAAPAAMPTPTTAGSAQSAKMPYLPPGVTQDMYDLTKDQAENMMGPVGDAARKQISDWGQSNPIVKGQIAGAEAAAKSKYETVDTLDPSGNFVTTVPKDKWLSQQGKAGESGAPGADGSTPPPASISGQAPPPHMMPKLSMETLGVKPALPDAPTGGGFPVVPPNAKSLTPGAEQMWKDAAGETKRWADDAESYDTQIGRLRSLAQMYKLTQTNEWADAKEAVAANLKEIYRQLDLPFTVGSDTFGDPAATQIAIKNATVAAFEQARRYTNRITNMELTGTTKSVAMPDLQPSAAYNIVINGIASAERGRAMMASWPDAQKHGWKNPLAYEQAWYSANPPDAWIQSTTRRAGNFAGMPLPAKEDLNTKASYVLRDGRLVTWDGKHLNPIKKSYTDLAIPPPGEDGQ